MVENEPRSPRRVVDAPVDEVVELRQKLAAAHYLLGVKAYALRQAQDKLTRIKLGTGLEIVDDTWLVLRTDGTSDTLYGVGEFPDTDAEPIVNLTEVPGWTAPRDGL